MREFFRLNHIPTKLLSLAIALLMWAFVVTSDNPTQTYSNLSYVPEIIGTEQLAERGLMITSGQDTVYHFSLKGNRTEISKLKELGTRGITVTTDLSSIEAAGVYPIRPTIKTEYAATVISASPSLITYSVEKVVSKVVPVEVVTTGELSSGFRLGDVTSDVQSVKITGAESYVASVESARATVDVTGRQEETVSAALELVDAQGEVVDSQFVSADITEVTVKIGIDQVASIPLSVTLIPSANLLTDMVDVKIEPESVQVYGDPDVIGTLKKLSLGTIDLAQVTGPTEEVNNLSIKLPEGVYLVEGQTIYPKITLTIDDSSETTVNVTDIVLEDKNADEQKPEVILLTEYIPVEIKGSMKDLNTLTADDLRITVTFDSSVLGTGVHTVDAKIEILRAGEFEIVNENETVSIEIKTVEEEEEQLPGDVTEPGGEGEEEGAASEI